MNLKPSAARTTLATALALALEVTGASGADPVPGRDVALGKNPGGQSVATTKTDKEGRFEFTKLKPGKYLVDLDQPQTRAAVNTSRSNIKRPGVAKQGDQAGVEVVEVSIEFTAGKGAKPHAPLEIEITGKSGTIKGIITRDDSAKPSEPKVADPKASKPKAK